MAVPHDMVDNIQNHWKYKYKKLSILSIHTLRKNHLRFIRDHAQNTNNSAISLVVNNWLWSTITSPRYFYYISCVRENPAVSNPVTDYRHVAKPKGNRSSGRNLGTIPEKQILTHQKHCNNLIAKKSFSKGSSLCLLSWLNPRLRYRIRFESSTRESNIAHSMWYSIVIQIYTECTSFFRRFVSCRLIVGLRQHRPDGTESSQEMLTCRYIYDTVYSEEYAIRWFPLCFGILLSTDFLFWMIDEISIQIHGEASILLQ